MLFKVQIFSFMLTHIRLQHAHLPNFKIQCNLQGCKQTYTKFTVYRNHIYNFHDIHGFEEEEKGLSSSLNGEQHTMDENDPAHQFGGTHRSTTDSIILEEDSTSKSLAGSLEQLKDASARWKLKSMGLCTRLKVQLMLKMITPLSVKYQ